MVIGSGICGVLPRHLADEAGEHLDELRARRDPELALR